MNTRRPRGLLLVLAASLAVAGAAHASVQRSDRQLSTMTVRELHAQRVQPATVVAFFARHGWLLAPRHATCWSHVPWSRSCNVARLARYAARVRVAAIDQRLGRLAALERARRAASAWPPHRRLWECISRYEGSPTSVNPNGHYGMLQMHADWGYGTSSHASDDPQIVQEWAAERAYAAANYSSSFLYGQWLNYDAADGCLAYR